MSKVLNKDKDQLEPAKKQQCPRCKGFGRIISDRGEACKVCKGRMIVWLSESGWLRALNSSKDSSILY